MSRSSKLLILNVAVYGVGYVVLSSIASVVPVEASVIGSAWILLILLSIVCLASCGILAGLVKDCLRLNNSPLVMFVQRVLTFGIAGPIAFHLTYLSCPAKVSCNNFGGCVLMSFLFGLTFAIAEYLEERFLPEAPSRFSVSPSERE